MSFVSDVTVYIGAFCASVTYWHDSDQSTTHDNQKCCADT